MEMCLKRLGDQRLIALSKTIASKTFANRELKVAIFDKYRYNCLLYRYLNFG